jgi:hypothetical protein
MSTLPNIWVLGKKAKYYRLENTLFSRSTPTYTLNEEK